MEKINPLMLIVVIIGCLASFLIILASLAVFSIFGYLTWILFYGDIMLVLLLGVKIKNGAN